MIKKLIILYIYFIFSVHAAINIHSKDGIYIDHVINNNMTYKQSLIITSSSNESKEFFIACSFGNKETLTNKNYNIEIHKKEKEIKDQLDTSLTRQAKSKTHALNYQIHHPNQPNTLIKTKFLALSDLEVLAGIIKQNESTNIDIFYDISIQTPMPYPGTYTDIFTLFLYEGSILEKQNAQLIESKDIQLIIQVPDITQINIPNQLVSNNITISYETNAETYLIATQKIKDKIKYLNIKNYQKFVLVTPISTSEITTITSIDK